MHKKLITLEKNFHSSGLTKLNSSLLNQHSVELWLKRDDQLDPIISGNKWRKLKYILDHALRLGAETIISMGGCYSNHLHALAYAGWNLGLKTKAYIRGERPTVLNPSLVDMSNWGMTLEFVSRSDYRVLRNFKSYHALPNIKPNQYWLPEGGATELALQGVAELVDEIDFAYDYIATPCGTGTTLAGIANALKPGIRALGVSALKGGDFLNAEVSRLCRQKCDNWQIILDYHFGGFAKTNEQLMLFIDQFERQQAIRLEPVYTGKMMFALFDLIAQGFFPAGSKIVALHTGGLQGRRGFGI